MLLGADALAKHDGEEPLDLDLTLRTADPGTDFPQPKAEVPAAPEKPAVPDRPAPQPAPENKPEPPKAPAALAPQPEKPRKKATQNPKNAPDVLLPQEQQEQQEMQQLKDMLNGMAAKPKPVEETLEPIRSVDVPLDDPEEPETPEKAPEPPRPTMVFAADKPLPEKKSVFRMFGDADDEKKPEVPEEPAAPEKTSPAAPVKAPEAEPETKPDEDTMSLPLEPLDAPETEPTETPVAAPAADTAEAERAGETELKTEAEDALPAEDEAPESVGEKLRRMSAELTLRCVLAGILAVVLLHVGLVADRLLPPLAALDPDAAPAAFYAANLLLYAASLVVSFPVLRDGLNGLRGRPSAETMPALAAVAALLQAVTALLTANSYRTTEGLSILTGVAALGLFLALLGSRVMLSAVRGGYELLGEATDLQGAYRTRDKDLIRALARDLEQKDPWVLLSRPRTADEGFVAQSLDERAGERRAQKNGYILLGVALLSALLCLVVGRDVKLAAAALTAVLCMGAPLSSTLIAGMAALRLQRAAGAVGAVVPGWAAIQELGGIDTLQVDAEDLFAADSVVLEDIRIFKGGRIDRAILYAASVLNQSGGTLQGLFRQIIEDRTDILFPVKDLEIHRGLGFAAWCDNNHIQIGTRRFLEQEGVALPDEDYENQHSKNGGAADPVSGGVRQRACHVRDPLCGRPQHRPQPCRPAAGEHPSAGHQSGPQPDRKAHHRGLPPARGHGHPAGSGAVRRPRGRPGRGCALLHVPSERLCQPDRRPARSRQGPERRDHGHHGADGVGAVLGGHCGAAHQRPQHLAAAGDLCADVSGGMERPEHRRVRPETA